MCVLLLAAIWFHPATTLLAAIPLLAGVPNKPVLLSPKDGGLMLGVAATSSVSQLLSTRGLQRCLAANAAAMGFTQVIMTPMYQRSSASACINTCLEVWGTCYAAPGVVCICKHGMLAYIQAPCSVFQSTLAVPAQFVNTATPAERRHEVLHIASNDMQP